MHLMQDFCLKDLGAKQELCLELLAAKEHFCVQTCWLQSKTFNKTFECNARLLFKHGECKEKI